MKKLTSQNLKLDWCTYKAAKFACENWHYSGSMPAGKLVKIGVWEQGKFVGVVIYGRGSNNRIGRPYGLKQTEICELVRVALTDRAAPTSKIVAISIKMLKKFCPGVRLIVSYADIDQDHEGIIYQATNWIYEGKVMEDSQDGSFIINGERVHGRTISARGIKAKNRLELCKKIYGPNVPRS